jgi:hypothetical protein
MCVPTEERERERETLMPSGSAMVAEEDEEEEALMEGKCDALRGSFGEVRGGRDGVGDEKVMKAYGGEDDDLGLNVVDESRFNLIERAINEFSVLRDRDRE